MTRLLPFLVAAAVLVGACAPDEVVVGPTPTPTPAVDAQGERPSTPGPTPAPTSVASPAPTPTAEPTPEPTPTTVALADEPEALAEQLIAAEREIRQDAQGEAVTAAAVVQQAAYRALAEREEWQEPVAVRIPDDLRAAFDANLSAAVALHALTSPQEDLPAWRIVEPAPAEELLGYYEEAEDVTGAPWAYLAAIHLVETRMGRIRGTSYAGAQGPMQFMPATWDHWGEGDVDDNRDAIMAAGRYLRDHGAPEDMGRAVYAYNHSQRYVDAVRAYAGVMAAEPATYRGYHAWQVYYRTTDGDVLLPVGWEGPEG